MYHVLAHQLDGMQENSYLLLEAGWEIKRVAESMYSVVQCHKKGHSKIYDILRQYPKLSEEGWGKNQEVLRPETPARA